MKIRGIAAPVRIYEAESQDAALDAAIETDSDPFGACCWPSAVVAARALAARDVAGLRVLELGAGTGLASAAAARLGADVVATDVSDISLELLRRAAADGGGAFDVQRLDFTDADAVAALGDFDVVVARIRCTRSHCDGDGRVVRGPRAARASWSTRGAPDGRRAIRARRIRALQTDARPSRPRSFNVPARRWPDDRSGALASGKTLASNDVVALLKLPKTISH